MTFHKDRFFYSFLGWMFYIAKHDARNILTFTVLYEIKLTNPLETMPYNRNYAGLKSLVVYSLKLK